jgi:thioredoxin-related protein
MKSLKSMTVLLCLLCLGLSSIAQGINWTTGLNWAAVQEKAKKENKYIFLDFYTTWCGPCKKMEKEVYVNDTVASFFNANFIPVKIQMDKTKADASEIQSWYADAEQLGKQFRIQAYPTYAFLAPDGRLSQQVSGYQNAQNFVEKAKTSLEPGRKFNDPNEKYYILLEQFNRGKKDYQQMPYLFDKAMELNDINTAKEISKEYKAYLAGLKQQKWFTSATLVFLAQLPLSSSSPFFPLFFKETKKVNNVTKKNGFAEKVVENVIFKEEALPFMEASGYGKPITQGGPNASAELDWDILAESISKKYPRSYVERTVLMAKVDWYEANRNINLFYKNFIQYIDKYGLEQIDKRGKMAPGWVNFHACDIFMLSEDRAILKTTAKWMKNIVDQEPENCMYIDTYANLLYKLGDSKKALEWEVRALNIALKEKYDQDAKEYSKVIEKIKKGKPTWN